MAELRGVRSVVFHASNIFAHHRYTTSDNPWRQKEQGYTLYAHQCGILGAYHFFTFGSCSQNFILIPWKIAALNISPMIFTDKDIYKDLLIIDIETVSCVPGYGDLSERMQGLWDKKASFIKTDEPQGSEELFFKRAAIYAEFGKVICVAIGFFVKSDSGEPMLRVKAIAPDDEYQLLTEFKALLEEKFDHNLLRLAGHNSKEFDLPYLCRRMLVNGVPIPETLQMSGKKPWEVRHIDTMEMWKFGDKKSFTSLDLLATLFGIESSKGQIDGSKVNEVYYLEKDLDKIADYCKKDVVVTAQLLLKLNGMDLVKPQNIQII